MPPPPSYLDITGYPFSRAITIAEFNAGTFGGTANTLWLRRVVTEAEIIGIQVTEGGNFIPRTTIYQSNGTTAITDADDSQGWWFYLTPGTYYIKVVKTVGGTTNFSFTVNFDTAEILDSIPNGTLLINDDTTPPANAPYNQFPATAWNPDGTFLGFVVGIPAGEIGDSLPNGFSLWHDRFNRLHATNKLALFNGIQYVTSVNVSLTGFPCISNDGTDFYVVNIVTGVVTKVTTGGVATAVATLGNSNDISAFGVSKDGTLIGYWAEGFDSASIFKWNLNTDASAGTLYTVPGLAGNGYVALTALNNHPGEILALPGGNIVTWCRNTSTGTDSLLVISNAGALLFQYNYTPNQIDHISYHPDINTKIYIWFFTDAPLGNEGLFGTLTLATGVVTSSFTEPLFSAGVNLIANDTDMFGPSASCTMLTIVYDSTPPTTGSITVNKVTINEDATVFEFSTTGLTPGTFSLSHGETQIFADLPPGTYAIEEILPDDWSNSVVVSNGSPITAITVEAGEAVTVTFTNIQSGNGGGGGSPSGIYEIIPGKRNDTLWLDLTAETTVDVKIPDPTIRTALLG